MLSSGSESRRETKKTTGLVLLAVCVGVVVCVTVLEGANHTPEQVGKTSMLKKKYEKFGKMGNEDVGLPEASVEEEDPVVRAERISGMKLKHADFFKLFGVVGENGKGVGVKADGVILSPVYGIKNYDSSRYLRFAGGGAGRTVNTQTYIGGHERFQFVHPSYNNPYYGIKSPHLGNYLRMKSNNDGVTTDTSMGTQARFSVFNLRLQSDPKSASGSAQVYLIYGTYTHQFLAVSSAGVSATTFPFTGAGYLKLIAA